MAEHLEYSATMEFDSEADLRAYLDHPAQVEARNATGERTIGILSVPDGKLSFVEQSGQVDWQERGLAGAVGTGDGDPDRG